jgi:hypothetical protein
VVREGKFLFAVTGEGRNRLKFVLPRGESGSAKPGSSVRIKPLDRKGPFGYPAAKVLSAAREEMDFAEVSKAFFKRHGIPAGYPKRAMAEAADQPEPVWENHRKRLDLRAEHIVTIDPADAKDHDDAISLEKLPDGRWKLGVHIADVSEYVALDGPLDDEALHRGYTQYLPWTAAPMLPQRLSGDLCSLLEGTTIALRFNRPTARGRELFGALVPYDAIWHPGADEASTISVSHPVVFGGQSLAAGTYSIWTIPTASEWTVILSSAAEVFHQPYPEGRDVLRVRVPSRRAAHMESMAFYFPFADRSRTALVLHWGDTLVEIPISTQ